MPRRYVFYGDDPLDKNKMQPITNRPLASKPDGGLWASPVDTQYGWADWCWREDFRDTSAQHKTVFSIENATVLKWTCAEDVACSPMQDVPPEIINNFAGFTAPDFEKISERYDAIEVKIDRLHHTLYGWDCDTLLVLNPEVIRVGGVSALNVIVEGEKGKCSSPNEKKEENMDNQTRMFSSDEILTAHTLKDLLNTPLKKRVAINWRRLRNERGMTIKQLSEKSGIAYSLLSNIENAKGRASVTINPTCANLAQAYNMALLDVIEELMSPIKEEDIINFSKSCLNDYASAANIPEFPANLVDEIMSYPFPGTHADTNVYEIDYKGVYEAISTLTEREQKVILMYYRDGKGLEECGKAFDVSLERMRQIKSKAVRKLSHPSRSKGLFLVPQTEYDKVVSENIVLERRNETLRNALCYLAGKKGVDPDNLEEYSEKAKAKLNDVTITELSLSRRARNCLARHGITSVEDLSKMSQVDLMNVRNLGRKSFEEILSVLKERFDIELPYK